VTGKIHSPIGKQKNARKGKKASAAGIRSRSEKGMPKYGAAAALRPKMKGKVSRA